MAAPLALLATGSAVTLGVLSADTGADSVIAQDTASISGAAPRDAGVSRSETRPDTSAAQRADRRADQRAEQRALRIAVERNARKVATRAAVRTADTRLWTTEDLNLWTGAGDDAAQDGEIEAGKRILVTGRKAAGRVEVVVAGQARWVTEGYLSDEKPVEEPAGLSMSACADPGVESGLTDNAVHVYRSVCNAFPQITSYGGWDGHGEHASGRALDIMTSDKELGDTIADFLQSHASELDLYDIIWWDQIWTPVRASEGWRAYGDHGSATANHMDHVHVSTY